MQCNIPLKFTPVLHWKIWGGDKIRRFYGKGVRHGDKIGESWELSDNDTDQTFVLGGPFGGENMRLLFEKYPEDIMGVSGAPAGRFPLLFKFIDAADNLSVQVHPGEGSSLGNPKTEAWYVVDVEKGAEMFVGINSALPREDILFHLRSPSVRTVLNAIPVKAGDVLFIPAGTVHAVPRGIMIYEVQQNSDTTFRLYDWDRVDENGLPRELHLNAAAEVLDFSVHDKHKIKPLRADLDFCRRDFLMACPYFAMVKYSDIRQKGRISLNGRFMVLTCMAGNAIISCSGGSSVLAAGETALVPAAAGEFFIHTEIRSTEVIASFIPDVAGDIAEPLERAGFSVKAVQSLGGRTKLKW